MDEREPFSDLGHAELDELLPIPKVIWWYVLETHYKGILNAKKCNELYNNELKEFFKKHPEELWNKVDVNFIDYSTNITKEEKRFYKKEIFGGV